MIELLVVIALILMLITMLLPALSRVRFEAQCATCAANLHNFAVACAHYASDNDDYLPRQDMVYTGHNLWDVDPKFINLMTGTYGLPRRCLYCPLTDVAMADELYTYTDPTGDTFRVIGYMLWIPRLNGTDMMPPLVPGTSPYDYPDPLDTTSFAGPQRIRDASVATNPIMTDMVGSAFNFSPPSNAQAGTPDDPYSITGYSNHKWSNLLVRCNQAYADGRVETVPASALCPRYKFTSNSWNWR